MKLTVTLLLITPLTRLGVTFNTIPGSLPTGVALTVIFTLPALVDPL